VPTLHHDFGEPAGRTKLTPARRLTESLRAPVTLTLLAGNGVLLVAAFWRLFVVLDGWTSGFGARASATFGEFVGPVALGLPMLALLLATHVAPPLPRGRAIVLAVLSEYAASAFFGAITFLGAFAYDIGAGRGVFVDLLERGVWLAFLVVACVIVARVWLGLFQAVAEPSYGQPYPGQPLIPAPALDVDDTPTRLISAPTASSPTGTIRLPADADAPTQVVPLTPPEQPQDDSGWPEVPPPPMPNPIVLEPDPTMRIVLPPSEPPAPRSGD
jgi:hypothetical protein